MTQITRLRDVVHHRATVTLTTGHVLEVRPVNVIDLMTLVSEFGPQVSLSYSRLLKMAKTKAIKESDVRQVLEKLLEECPQLLAALLALSSDDNTPEGRQAAAGLNLVDQLALFDTLFRETLHSEATVKKLLASLSASAMTVFGALKTPKTAISNPSTGRPGGR